MSWKATAYVKGLHAGISATEKLLLFVLADYHNTAHSICWPSLPILAQDALMSERNARRVLVGLEAKNIVERVIGTGRGNKTLYRFVELDVKEDKLSPFNVAKGGQINTQRRTNTTVKEDITGTAIRKERVRTIKQQDCEKCFGKGSIPIKSHPGREIYCDCSAGLHVRLAEKPLHFAKALGAR